MSVKEQDLIGDQVDALVDGFYADAEEQELYRLQQLTESELPQYQQFLEDGFNNEIAYQMILDARLITPEPEPIEETIKKKITAVHYLRQAKTAMMDDLASRKIAFDAENAELLSNIANNGSELTKAESDLRGLAIEIYDGKNKKPFPGCGIRVSTKIATIYDDSKALAWAKQKDICLTLDVKAFEEICKTASKPDFVQCVESETTSATIDTDLSKALVALEKMEVL